MKTHKCFDSACAQDPNLLCTCTSTQTFMCSDHINKHIGSTNTLIHNLENFIMPINQQSKQEILSLLIQEKSQMETVKRSIIKSFSHAISSLDNLLENNLSLFAQYQAFLDQNISTVTNTEKISKFETNNLFEYLGMKPEEAITNASLLLADIRNFNKTAKSIDKFIIKIHEKISNLDINSLDFEKKEGSTSELSKWEKFFILLDKDCKAYTSLSPYYHFKNGLLLHQSGMNDVALYHFNIALECEPSYADALYYKGLALLQLNKKEEALLWWNKLIEIKPNFSIIYYSKARALEDLNRREESIENWNKFIQLRPNSGFGYLYKSITLQGVNRFNESIDCLNQSINCSPKYFRAYAFKAESLQKQERYQEAADCIKEFIQADPDYFAGYNMLGSILLQENKFEESIKNFDDAIKRNSKLIVAYKNKADALNKLGQIKEALDCYNEALMVSPNGDKLAKIRDQLISKVNKG